MKLFKASAFLIVFFAAGFLKTEAQVKIRKPKTVIEQKASNRANRKIDQTIDKGFDKLEEGIDGIFRKKDKNENEKEDRKSSKESEANNTRQDAGRASGGTARESTAVADPKTPLQAYSKFDYIPGEKIVASEDFSQDAVGDFPAKWNTNGTAEVVTIEDMPGRWLMVQHAQNISYIPDFVQDLPDNFTFEFDLIYNNWEDKQAFQRRFFTTFHEVEKSDARIQAAAAGRGATLQFDGGMKHGKVFIFQTGPSGGYTDLRGEKDMAAYINPDFNGKIYHIALWRQKTRLRVYVDEQKVFDLPRIFPADIKLNAMRFHSKISNEDEQVFISNIRLAVGAPDTRSKLITEGKFVTTGITFDVNSATIRPESYAVLKDIAGTLSENPSVKVRIIGHTDSDGDDASNLNLSRKRAESVKESLVNEFGIDNSRLETDGKGEGDPAAPNTTPEGKANNRRVEFVKM